VAKSMTLVGFLRFFFLKMAQTFFGQQSVFEYARCKASMQDYSFFFKNPELFLIFEIFNFSHMKYGKYWFHLQIKNIE
jgi:hypothetical protein